MIYLTFAKYQELGGTLDESSFVRAEFRARMKIDSVTFNRLRNLPDGDPRWETAQFLVLELIERGLLGRLDGKDTKSESVGKVSVVWEDKEGLAVDLIEEYLGDMEIDGAPLFRSGIQFAKVLRV